MSSIDNRSIAVFDSGVGGLTVLAHLLTQFPEESFIYLGDTARLPYGDKSSSTISKYVLQNIKFLKKQNVKAVVVACNSASSVIMQDHFIEGVPVFNVIEPGSRAAIQNTKNNKIGIVATQATVRKGAYPQKLIELSPHVLVRQVDCPLLVPLVEQNWIDDVITDQIIVRYLEPLKSFGMDTLILGCTHYPLLKDQFKKVLGEKVFLVQSGEAVAQDLLQAFKKLLIFPANKHREIQILTTDLSLQLEGFARSILKTDAFTGPQLVDI